MAYSQWDVTRETPPFDLEKQKKEGQELLGRYTGAITGLETVPALASRYEGQLGIPNLREQYFGLGEVGEGLRTGILNMPRQVADTSRESLLTQGQKTGLVQAQQRPMIENLNEVGRLQAMTGERLSGAETNLNKLMGYEMAQQERSLLPFEKEFSMLEQYQAREYSGYTFLNQMELNRLLSNASMGEKWTTEEANRANALALAEWSYKQALDSVRETGSQNRQTFKYSFDLDPLGLSLGRK